MHQIQLSQPQVRQIKFVIVSIFLLAEEYSENIQKGGKKATAWSIPRRSPIQVLTPPDAA